MSSIIKQCPECHCWPAHSRRCSYSKITEIIDDYFEGVRSDGYIVDGVDAKELAYMIRDANAYRDWVKDYR